MDNVILISYPSGGFGNFIFHVLTTFSTNTYKVDNQFDFSITGNSHKTIKYAGVYFMDPNNYILQIPDPNKKTLVLCDNGITNDSYTKIEKTFPGATIVRLCISVPARPIIYQTCIIKAKQDTLLNENASHIATNWSDSDEAYAIRENFTFLYHNWNFGWGPIDGVINVDIEKLITNPVDVLCKLIVDIGGEVNDLDGLSELCVKWKELNQQYFKIYQDWQNIESALAQNNNIDLSNLIDLHSQGYINYCIERKFNVIIPVYDYRHWFKNTNEILEMIQCLK